MMLDHKEFNHTEGWGGDLMPVMLALATSIFFGSVLWLWNSDLLWMLAVLLPPIWSPVMVRRFGHEEPQTFRRVAVIGVAAGLAILLAVLVVVFALS